MNKHGWTMRWLIVATTAASTLCIGLCPAAEPNTPAGWFAMEPATDDFSPTILDCAPFIEAPTGKHGFVTVKGDNFVFEDGTPVRFWGSQAGGRGNIDYTLKRMRRQGINMVRQHGLNGLTDPNGKSTLDYSERGFDRLDNFIAKLGENGIYITLDPQYPLFSRYKAGDNIPQLPQGGSAPYAQFFNDRIGEITRKKMVDIFTHYNPYTKKRYCDDPTLAMVEIVNEESMFWGGTVTEPFIPELDEKFAAWLKKKYGSEQALLKAWTVDGKSPLKPEEGIEPGRRMGLIKNYNFVPGHLKNNPQDRVRGLDQLRFCYELEDNYWQSCVKAMRDAGLKVPICGTNWQGHGFTTRIHLLGQSKLDYVDRHGYWDHPEGEGELRWQIGKCNFHNLPMVKAVKPNQRELIYLGVGNLVTDKAWEQVLGKPLAISEWDTCLPNEYCLEGTGLMAAYGLLQGWDYALQGGYGNEWPTKLSGGSFNIVGNPPHILQFPAVATMFLRGDVKEAKLVAESVYTPDGLFDWTADVKPAPLAAALVGKVGCRFVNGKQKPVVKNISKWWDADKLLARSITGELTWDAKNGIVHIDTPRTQAVIGFLSAQPHKLGNVQIESQTNFGAFYVTAMDGDKSIASAKRLLITAVGPARNTNMEYERTDKKSDVDNAPFWHLKNEGNAPLLLNAITGRLQIRCQNAKNMKCWILNIVGKRGAMVPLTVEKGAVVLTMQPEHKTVYYEISAE